MKTLLHFLFLLFFIEANAQITTPIIKANFGVDADLRANYFNGFAQNGNDDWFANSAGTGAFIIDTTGAAAMVARYTVDPNFRKLPFFRTMRFPQYSIINNRLLIDAVYIRDYNGQAGGDSTAFVTSNKNGDNPGVWDGGVTSVLDKNDIADMMVHVRREGPTKSDSLWFFGGISLQGTTGNRYFDFELYQTDIFYSRTTGQFTNYGPDAGHTSWTLDAGGNIIQSGDVIFSAEYSSSSLSNIEARIWVRKSTMSITPADFDWTGSFDGADAGAQFGYAGIRPKAAGNYYSGLQSTNNTWAGPFGFIDGGNNFVTTYTARQYMEFSVNLSKLGLDPITLLGSSACGLPFRRILVKTRSSTAFTAELKDFIGPFDFFTAAPVQAQADVPFYCGEMGVSNISVTNPLPASVYNWTTLDGRIVNTNGSTITVDTPGTYIVSQQLLDGCGNFAKDTVVILFDPGCTTMSENITDFKASIKGRETALSWIYVNNDKAASFIVQRSEDGLSFTSVQSITSTGAKQVRQSYSFNEQLSGYVKKYVYYRLQIKGTNGAIQYSRTIRLAVDNTGENVGLYPNPARQYVQVSFNAPQSEEVRITVMNSSGQNVHLQRQFLNEGFNVITMDFTSHMQPGMYMLGVTSATGTKWSKLIIRK